MIERALIYCEQHGVPFLGVWETACMEDPSRPERHPDWIRAWGPAMQAADPNGAGLDLLHYIRVSETPEPWKLIHNQRDAEALAELAAHPYFARAA
jgi:hypothetical protein